MAGVEYQVTKVDPTDPHTKGAVYQVHEVSEEVAATLGGKVYRARIIKDPTAPTVVGKVYQIVLIEDPSDPTVKGKVYNAILTGDSAAVVVGPAVSPLVLQGAIANSLQYVKAFGGTEQNGTPTPDAPVDIVSNNGVLKVRHQSGLPLGYTLLDYVESSGTQYIDTNILIQSEYQRVVSKFSADGMDYALRCFGSQDTTGICTIVPWPATAQSYPWGYLAVGTSWYAPNGQNNPIVTALNTVYEIDVTANNGILTGTYCGETISTTYAGTLCNNLSITLFGNKRSSTNIQMCSFAKVRIYYYKLYTAENVLTANYIPAKNSSNVVGMYDTVSDTFLTNAGTGEFVAGSPVNDPVEIYADGTVETIKDSLNNTATAEMLLKVGDYQDEQEILSGDVTHKIGVKVLDGTEDWAKGQSFYCNALAGVLQADHSCYCTHYQGIMNNSAVVTDSNTCRVGYHIGSESAWGRLYIYADRSLYATAQDFANYLAQQYAAGTPVIVVYPLATPTTESVAGQTMQVQTGDNVLEITQASLTGLGLEAEYQKW